MPRRANAYVRIAHANGPSGSCVTNNLVQRTTVKSNMKARIIYTWLVKTLHNMLSSFAISLVLFCPLGFSFFLYIDFAAFSFSMSPTVRCIQHSTPQNTYIAKDKPRCPSRSRSAILSCPLVSISCPARSPPSSVHVMHEFLARECK